MRGTPRLFAASLLALHTRPPRPALPRPRRVHQERLRDLRQVEAAAGIGAGRAARDAGCRRSGLLLGLRCVRGSCAGPFRPHAARSHAPAALSACRRGPGRVTTPKRLCFGSSRRQPALRSTVLFLLLSSRAYPLLAKAPPHLSGLRRGSRSVARSSFSPRVCNRHDQIANTSEQHGPPLRYSVAGGSRCCGPAVAFALPGAYPRKGSPEMAVHLQHDAIDCYYDL